MSNNSDNIYRKPYQSVPTFEFDDRVADVFADMIARSVPGYAQILALLPTLTRYFRCPGYHYYDLGCSLGAGMLALGEGLQNTACTIIGVDNSTAMLERAQPLLNNYTAARGKAVRALDFQLVCADIASIEMQPAALVLMNFTLQFIPIKMRDALVAQIFNSLKSGGALVLSEKISFDDQATDRLLIDIHHQYKADQGYSALEISQKRDAIENVLIPETLERHSQRLLNAGFSIVTPWVQNLQFVSMLAVK